jgi:hypothetical protein
MKQSGIVAYSNTWVEAAIIAKWTLQEAWLCCMDVLENGYKHRRITRTEKIKLEEMYTAFYQQGFYGPARSKQDADKLLQYAKNMLSMLKELDHDSWFRLVCNDTSSGFVNA